MVARVNSHACDSKFQGSFNNKIYREFTGRENFNQDISEAKKLIKGSPAIDLDSPILLPGEVEENTKRKNQELVEIPAKVWEKIVELEKSLALT